jgi:hypothetical protein
VLKVNLPPFLGTDKRRSLPIGSQNRTLAPIRKPSRVQLGLLTCTFDGVSDGIRTHDTQDHNLVL